MQARPLREPPVAPAAPEPPPAVPDPPRPGRLLTLRSPVARTLWRLGAGVPLAAGVRFWEAIGRYEHLHRLIMRVAGMPSWPGPGFGDYPPTARDVIVVTYPKSGTNLALQLLTQLARGGRGEYEHIHDACPWPDGLRLGAATLRDDDGAGRFRAIKTHLPLAALPLPAEPGPARWVYVVRDPREVFVSSYHFVRGLAYGPAMPTVGSWVGTWERGEFHFGPWAEHIADWWPLRHRPDVLFLTFRELTRETPAALDRLAAFCGVTLSSEERAAVLRRSSRDWMKRHDDVFRPGVSLPWADGDTPMVRRGESGSAGELLSPDQAARVAAASKRRLAELGCDLPFDAMFGPPGDPPR